MKINSIIVVESASREVEKALNAFWKALSTVNITGAHEVEFVEAIKEAERMYLKAVGRPVTPRMGDPEVPSQKGGGVPGHEHISRYKAYLFFVKNDTLYILDEFGDYQAAADASSEGFATHWPFELNDDDDYDKIDYDDGKALLKRTDLKKIQWWED